MNSFSVGIQSRALSKRLPNKNFFNLGSLYLCEWSINQSKVYFPKSQIYLLVPNDKYFPIFEEIAKSNNINILKGDEFDVLSRYEDLAKKVNSDFIVRWTGDNPIKCEFAMEKLLKNVENNFDYICYEGLRKTAVEIISRSTLINIRNSEYYSDKCSEHVTWGLRNKSNLNKLILKPDNELTQRSNDQLLSIDTIDDFVRVNKFIEKNNIKPKQKNKIINKLSFY
tara:strand:- start:1111 stop:1785 length:675 start_codon:yes stop_codon:yes gene_type:complete